MAKAGETPSNDEELLQEIREFAKKSNAELGTDLARVVSDLEFEGGAQFEASDDALRGPGRAKVIFNFTRNYCNSLINTFRNKPYGIILDARTGDGVDKATITQGIIRGIESKCDAVGAYTVAVDRQIKGGRGYCVVTSDYASEDGWDQEIRIQSVIRPDMVIWDVFSSDVTGKDATQAAFVEHISKSRANDLYGLDLPQYGRAETLLQDTRWIAPEDSVEVITYFKLHRTKSKIYQDDQGNTVTEARKNTKMKSRSTTKTSVRVTKVIAKEIIGTTELPLSRLPIVPFLGEMVDVNRKTNYVGLVYFARDPAKLINGMASLTAERINLSPKATQYTDMRSIINYKDIWQQSNKISLPYLPYDSVDAEGNVLEKPTPRDVQVQISDVTGAQQIYQANLASVLGIPEAGLQGAGASNETAASVLTRNRSTELSNYQFLDNAAKSIAAIGRVVLEMLPIIYDTERLIPVKGPEGVKLQTVDVGQLGLIASEFEVSVDAGPMTATQRKEELNALIALGGMLGPDVTLAFASDIVRNAEFSNSEEIARKIDSVARSKGIDVRSKDEATDPDAEEALQQADQALQAVQQQLDQANNYVQQLQQELMAQKEMSQAEIVKAQIGAKSRIDVEGMKIQGKANETQLKIQADSAQALQDAQVKMQIEQAKINAMQPALEPGFRPDYDSVGGMRNKPF